MPVNTSDVFFRVLKKSNLLSNDELEQIRGEFAGEADPKNIASSLIKSGVLNRWQALHLLAGRYALTLGKYKFLGQIDSDRTERVYLAKHPKLGRRVAIKTLSRTYVAKNPKALKQFLNQARKVAALDHPNITHIYDIDNDEDRYFLVMEHIQGRNLQDTVQTGGLIPVEQATRYIRQIADALSYAHERGLVHGQLNARGVLLDKRENVRILNLGITIPGAAELDQSFTAPEQLEGQSPSPASDIFSIGCLAYLLLTGKVPDKGGPEKLLELRPDIPRDLADFCARMMATTPESRVAAASEISERMATWCVESDEEPDLAAGDSVDDESSSVGDLQFVAIDGAEIEEIENEPNSIRDLDTTDEAEEIEEVEEIEELEESEDALEPSDEKEELKIAPLDQIKINVPGAKSKPAHVALPDVGEAPAKPPRNRPREKPAPAASKKQPPKPAAAPAITATASQKQPPAKAAPPKKAKPNLKQDEPAPQEPKPAAAPAMTDTASQKQPPVKAAPPKKAKPNLKQDEPAPTEPKPAPKKKKGPAIVVGPATPPASSDSGQFPVDLGPKRKRKKTAAGAAATATAASGSSGGPGRIPPKALIIGGAAVGGLVLLGGLILGTTFIFSGGEQEVAAVDPTETDTTAASDADVDADPGVDPESDPLLDAETDPETDPVMPAASSPETDPVVPAASSPSDAVATVPDNSSTTDASAEEPATDGGSAGTTPNSSDQPTDPAPAEPKPSEPPADTSPQPSENKGGDPKPATKPKPATAPKKPAGPAKKPFQDLGGQLKLPDLTAEDATKLKELGSVYIPDGELCFVKLRGDDNACKGSQSFDIKPAEGGLAERDWDISLLESEGGPQTKIAHLAVNDKAKLTFQWQPEAKEQPAAAHLQNCALFLSCASESRECLFREATVVEGLAIDFQKPSTREDWDIDMLPEERTIRLEVLPVTGAKASIEQKPEQLSADNGGARVRLEEGGGIMSFQIVSKIGRRFEVTVTPYVKLSDNEPEITPNQRKLQADSKELMVGISQFEPMIKRQEDEIRKMRNPDEKKRAEQKLFPYKANLDAAKKRLARIQQVEKLLETLGPNLRFNFRVYYHTGLTDVDLLKIGS